MPYVIGMISGTSLDGIDAALVELGDCAPRLAAFITQPIPDALRSRILDTCSLDRSHIALTCSLNVELGYAFAQAAQAVCDQAGFDIKQLECIGSHGQTVYHIAFDEPGLKASTLQIGEPAVIAYETGIPVVSSFRAMDMAAGGQGAPLVPYTEFLLYRGDKARALQNLGGIGNVTVLPKHCALEDLRAFDTGPANMIINDLCQRLYGLPYDDGGAIAASGQVSQGLLDAWMAIPYVLLPPPKSTGRELYGAQFVDKALAENPGISPQDWLCTATMYTALSMAENYRRFVFPYCALDQIILGGGGVHNKTLRHMIQDLLPECPVLTQDELGYSSDAKEAIAFALLAHETMRGLPGNAPAATGASRQVILGNITPAPLGQKAKYSKP